jgi:hypothetical protein
LNEVPNEPRRLPRWHRLILVDLVAMYLPWLLLVFLFIANYVLPIFRAVHPRPWVLLLGPVHSPFMFLGIWYEEAVPPEFSLMCVVFLAHCSLVVYLHRRWYRWLKYVVPAHLFLVSAFPVTHAVWMLFER